MTLEKQEEARKIKKEQRKGGVLEAAARHTAAAPEDKDIAAILDTMSWPDPAQAETDTAAIVAEFSGYFPHGEL